MDKLLYLPLHIKDLAFSNLPLDKLYLLQHISNLHLCNHHLHNMLYPNNHNNKLYLPLVNTQLYLNRKVLLKHNLLSTLLYLNSNNNLLYLNPILREEVIYYLLIMITLKAKG